MTKQEQIKIINEEISKIQKKVYNLVDSKEKTEMLEQLITLRVLMKKLSAEVE